MKPTVTPKGSPAPPTPNPGATTKRPRKAALSDVTNLPLLRLDTRTPIKPGTPGRRPLQQPSASTTCSSSASVTPKRPSAAAVLDSVVKSPAISTVYARRGTTESGGRRRRGALTTSKTKGRERAPFAVAAGAASCPQLGKSSGNRNRKTSVAQGTWPISSSAPCHEAKKKRPSSTTPKLPEDFVKKQRAYFAEIDAFELPEEEVLETDLD